VTKTENRKESVDNLDEWNRACKFERERAERKDRKLREGLVSLATKKWLQRQPPRLRPVSFEVLEVHDWNKDAMSGMRQLAEDAAKMGTSGMPSVHVAGGVGTGKTALVQATRRHIVEVGTPPDVRPWTTNRSWMATWPDFLMALKRLRRPQQSLELAWADLSVGEKDVRLKPFYLKSEAALIEFVIKMDLLVIDDLGAEESSDYSQAALFQILDGRYQAQRPTIVTSNVELGDAADAGILDRRCASRISEGGLQFVLKGPDFRPTRSKERRSPNAAGTWCPTPIF
jgi:DNA replication protein DnaC